MVLKITLLGDEEMFTIGQNVVVVKCPQCPRLVGKVGEIIEQHSETMFVVQFNDGYSRIIRAKWLTAL